MAGSPIRRARREAAATRAEESKLRLIDLVEGGDAAEQTDPVEGSPGLPASSSGSPAGPLPLIAPLDPSLARASVRTVAELHDRILAAAEQTLNRYLAESKDVDTHALPGHLEKLCSLTLKLQSGIDREPSPQGSDLDQRRAERAKLLALKASKVAPTPDSTPGAD